MKDSKEGSSLMGSGIILQPLDIEHIDTWLDIHRSVYSRYPWPKRIEQSDVEELLDSPEKQVIMALTEGDVFGIAVLQGESDSDIITLKDFSARNSTAELVDAFLEKLISIARELGARKINTWMWSSEEELLTALMQDGFVVELEHSLVSRNLTIIPVSEPVNNLEIHSLSDRVSIADFVKCNRKAFKEDPSRPLEESELEDWITNSEGFHPEFQLVAILDGEIVGTVMSEMTTHQNSSIAWTHGLGVLKEYRRRDIASNLLTELMIRLRKRGVNALWLFTDTIGPIREFYDSLGFTQYVNWMDMNLDLYAES